MLSFGRATYGRLGRPGPDTQSDEPYDAPERVELPGAAVRISAGVSVSAAVLASGAVHLWGYGDTGTLTHPPRRHRRHLRRQLFVHPPTAHT